MFERFTSDSVRVIMLAQEETRRLGHNFVGSEQILLGLIGNNSGVTGEVFKKMNVNLAQTRREVENIIGRGSGDTSVEIPFTTRAKRILERSWEEARLLRNEHIDSEHLLLGILFEESAVAVQALQAQGIEVGVMRDKIYEKLGVHEPVSPDVRDQLMQMLQAVHELSSVHASLNDLPGALDRALESLKLCADQIEESEMPAGDQVQSSSTALSAQLATIAQTLLQSTPILHKSIDEIQEQLARIQTHK